MIGLTSPRQLTVVACLLLLLLLLLFSPHTVLWACVLGGADQRQGGGSQNPVPRGARASRQVRDRKYMMACCVCAAHTLSGGCWRGGLLAACRLQTLMQRE